jgi:P27 family predicted phage terminase small subunit
MGLRGKFQQSEAEAKLKGTFRKDRYSNKQERIEGLTYLDSLPEAPDTLNEDGKRYWNTTLGNLIQNDYLIAKIDLYVFTQLCYNYQLLMEFTKEMNEKGQTYIDNKGKVRISIYVRMYSETFKAYLSVARMFGLTPASRENLHSKPEISKKDLLKDFQL